MGIVSERRKRQRMQRIKRRLLVAVIVVLLGFAAMSPGLRQALSLALEQGAQAAQAFGRSEQAVLTLPEREVFALQLGVFDNGERAASEAERLQQQGVRCVLWQREKMRIISRVAPSRQALDLSSAKENEAYVIRDVLPEVAMRVEAGSGEIAEVQALLTLPDSVLTSLLDGSDSLSALVAETKEAALAALNAHPENALYTQLAQSLSDWCALIGEAQQEDGEAARSYAAAAMHLLCYELRLAIKGSAP